MAFAAQYAHPIEHIVANLLPILLPLIYRQSHIVTFGIYLAYSLLETAITHSGYDFFGPIFKVEMHDIHHEKFNGNYGGLFMDYVHGTYLPPARNGDKKVRKVE
jgi:sterol desaturase/sphingolipid hydroxylase (fatty acid hydroxylase superfamily)